MKKTLFVIIFLCVTSVSSAQIVGIKGGINFSNLLGDIDTATYKLGFQAGVMAEIKLISTFYIQPELLFTLQGAIDSEHAEEKVSLNYVAFPLIFKYYVSRGFNLQLGSRAALLVMAQTTIDETDYQIKDELNSFDAGIVGGIGYQKEYWNVSGRYYHGLTDIKKAEGANIQNQMLQFSIAYFFIRRNENPYDNRRR